MSKPIQVGDLVMVVRGCKYCGWSSGVGFIFTAQWVGIADGETQCCGAGKGVDVLGVDSESDGGDCFDMYECIRIDPPATGDSLPTRKRMKEPA